jgi:hypothetical protein
MRPLDDSVWSVADDDDVDDDEYETQSSAAKTSVKGHTTGGSINSGSSTQKAETSEEGAHTSIDADSSVAGNATISTEGNTTAWSVTGGACMRF